MSVVCKWIEWSSAAEKDEGQETTTKGDKVCVVDAPAGGAGRQGLNTYYCQMIMIFFNEQRSPRVAKETAATSTGTTTCVVESGGGGEWGERTAIF